ncbi:MAG: helix-turn-helix transcriptional regulator [Bacteroidota bacterium]
MAEIIGVTESTVTNWEKYRTEPNSSTESLSIGTLFTVSVLARKNVDMPSYIVNLFSCRLFINPPMIM